MTLWSHYLSVLFTSLIPFRICMTYQITCLPLRLRAVVMNQLIGNSATNNSLFMIFELLLRTDSPHPCSMIWKIIRRTIVPCLMKIGVTSCPQSRLKIIGKGQRHKSRRFHLWERPLILILTNPLGFLGRRRLVLFSSAISLTKIHPNIMVHSATVWFAIRKEFLS